MQMQEQNSALQAQVMALEAALMAAKVSIRDPSDFSSLDGPGMGSGGLQTASGEGGGNGNGGFGGAAANGGAGAGARYRERVAAVQAFVQQHRVKELHAAGGVLARLMLLVRGLGLGLAFGAHNLWSSHEIG